MGNLERSFPDKRKSRSRSLMVRTRRPWRFSQRLQTSETASFRDSGSLWRILRRRESGKERVRSMLMLMSVVEVVWGFEMDLGD